MGKNTLSVALVIHRKPLDIGATESRTNTLQTRPHVYVLTRDHPELLTFEKSRHRNRLVLAWLHLFWQKNVVQQV